MFYVQFFYLKQKLFVYFYYDFSLFSCKWRTDVLVSLSIVRFKRLLVPCLKYSDRRRRSWSIHIHDYRGAETDSKTYRSKDGQKQADYRYRGRLRRRDKDGEAETGWETRRSCLKEVTLFHRYKMPRFSSTKMKSSLLPWITFFDLLISYYL